MNYKRTQDGLRTPWLGDMNTYARLPKLQILVAGKTNCKTYINVLFEPSVGYNPPRSFFRRALDDGIQRSKVLFHLGNQTFHNRDQNNIHPALLKDQAKHLTPFLSIWPRVYVIKYPGFENRGYERTLSAIASKRFSKSSKLKAPENEISSQCTTPWYTKMIVNYVSCNA